MGIKGKDHPLAADLTSPFHHLFNDLLMSEMEAVKIAH
jgi:hypothetical protein